MAEFSTDTTMMVVLVSGSVAKFLFGAMTWSNRKKRLVQVGTVSQLNFYPIKSCRGFSVQRGRCTSLGLQVGGAVDRHWVVTRANGDFITQRQFPKMALIGTELRDNSLLLTAPGMPPLTVPLSPPVHRSNIVDCRVWHNKLQAVEVGEEVGGWLSTFLQEAGLRLLWASPVTPRVDVNKKANPWGNSARPGDQAGFVDFCSFMVLSEASLASLNQRLKRPVTMATFRPSIVLSGCPAFDEDNWAEVVIGETATFRVLDSCPRCLLTTVKQDTGEKDPDQEPLATLKTFRCFPKYGTSPLFGTYCTADVEGEVKVGDPVYAIRK